MLRQLLIYLFPIYSCFAPWATVHYLSIVGSLPDALEECSGMAVLPGGRLAMINDSGNEPALFVTDSLGKLERLLHLPQLKNVDWEEVIYHQQHLYIGDFGNNANRRQDLKIYKIALDSALQIGATEEIRFRYSRQKSFPPADSERHFDMEAMVAAGDSLYLFSKNRSDPFNGYTYQYALPTVPGDYTISPSDSLLTGLGNQSCQWVTAAALDEENRVLCLLGYQQMWVLRNFKGHAFLRGELERLRFDEFTQKEACSFLQPGELLIADERNLFEGGFLYRMHLNGQKDVTP